MQAKSEAGNKSSLDFTRKLDCGNNVIAEYIWIDGQQRIRGKARTLAGVNKITSVDQLPEWNFDGSSCYLADTENSEVIMKPVSYFPDPFRGAPHIIVMTETFVWEDTTYQKLVPTPSNFRHFAKEIFAADSSEHPWYGIEQEYTFLEDKSRFNMKPYGWPDNGYPGAQGPYYCSAGANVCFGRTVADAHYKCCLYAGVTISGTNAEVMPGQWEYQVGPCEALDMGDHLWISRYLLHRCAEEYGLIVSFDPKIFEDWNGSGCHCNYSTETMRSGKGGMKYIQDMMTKFEAKHETHMKLYGEDNNKRLTGIHETSSYTSFSYGTGNRAASFRIPTSVTHANGKGYIEDRRPASNIDPYLVSSIIYDTSVLKASKAANMVDHFDKYQQLLKQQHIEKA